MMESAEMEPAENGLPAAIYPVRILREQVTALEAAMMQAISEPTTGPVHRLRTTTRRMEGQLALLEAVLVDAADPKHAARVRRMLQRVRRAAGRVRDLDVQCQMLQSLCADGQPANLAREAGHLRGALERKREERAAGLSEGMDKHSAKLTRRMEKLLKALAPVEDQSIAPARLQQAVREFYQARAAEAQAGADRLHDQRKAAKLARYMAETAKTPEGWVDRGVAEWAKKFESLQKSGGEWHDLFTLARIARRSLGRGSALAVYLKAQRAQALSAYERQLADFADCKE